MRSSVIPINVLAYLHTSIAKKELLRKYTYNESETAEMFFQLFPIPYSLFPIPCSLLYI